MARRGFNFRSFMAFILHPYMDFSHIGGLGSGLVYSAAGPHRQLDSLATHYIDQGTVAGGTYLDRGCIPGGWAFPSAQVQKEYGLSSEAAIQSLAAKGIQAKADDKMRDIANRSGRKPYEVIEILKGDQKK